MNRKGSIGDLLMSNAIYLILLVALFVVMFMFVQSKQSGAGVWEDIYVKEIVKTIDLAKPGDEIILDVHTGTEIAQKNKVTSYSNLFRFNNAENEVCVSLSRGRESCYYYFNEVDVVNPELRLGKGKETKNVLYFEVVGKQRVENE